MNPTRAPRALTRLRGRLLVACCALLGLLAAGALVWQSSRAAFTAQTANPANSWAAGSVALSDNDSGSAQFSSTGLSPGNQQSHCITVNYNGGLSAAITLYATASSGALAPYLDLTVEEGSGGSFGSCAGFTATAVDYAGTVADFAATRTQFSTGVGFFAPAAAGRSSAYRFITTLNDAAPNSTQGSTASLDLRWEAHSVSSAALLATGNNNYGQLGLGDTTRRTTMTAAGPATAWRQTSASPTHTCAVREDGTLWCSGQNTHGELGLGDTTGRSGFTRVGSQTNWMQASTNDGDNVSGTGSYTCALQTNGTLWCWGDNNGAQLGQGNTTDRTTPTQVAPGSTWTAVSAGQKAACAVRTDGTLWCWGENNEGALGQGDTTNRSVPTQVGSLATWATASMGARHTCALRTDKSLWCWGRNLEGQIGQGNTTNVLTPIRVGAQTTWSVLSTGWVSTCAVKVTGTLWCWGGNNSGQQGQGDTINRTTPTQVGSLTTWSSVAGGLYSTCAVQADRGVWCWGNGYDGQLGLGDTADRAMPVRVPGISARALSAGSGSRSRLVVPWPS